MLMIAGVRIVVSLCPAWGGELLLPAVVAALLSGRSSRHRAIAVTGSNVNREREVFSAAFRPNLAACDVQIAQQAGGLAVVAYAGEPLSPQT
jgi:hypothetical protein